MPASSVVATYRLHRPPAEAATLARRIAYEQTVELPEAQVTDPALLAEVVGHVLDVRADGHEPDTSVARIAYPIAAGNPGLPALLNLVFGNVSIVPGVRLLALNLPDAMLAGFDGPLLGIAGLRELVGVHGRPLLATAIKPRGISVQAMAAIAGDFARGGGDIVKDDQNLAGDDIEAFKRRVTACAEAVARANEDTGRCCLYFPHVSGGPAELERRLALVRHLRLAGVLVCPLIIGLETARELCAAHGLAMMAHPALTGSYTNAAAGGIAHALLLGTCMRLAGADVSVFPNHGGRFSFSRAQCLEISAALRGRLGALAQAFPAPAGGMSLERLPDMAADYGVDTVWLIGGALLGDAAGVESATRRYLDEAEALFPDATREPGRAPALVLRQRQPPGPATQVLPLTAAFTWRSREARVYKDAAGLPFRGVSRVELVGYNGERTAFDLRYFEVTPGGWSSLEKHLHAHAVIAARGHGVLVAGDEHVPLSPHEVAYIAPLTVHQLRNEGDEPFGFYCIVDHHRDRPMRP